LAITTTDLKPSGYPQDIYPSANYGTISAKRNSHIRTAPAE
jgi:hypothetical protein